MNTSLALRAKGLNPASSNLLIRSSLLIKLIGSTILILNGGMIRLGSINPPRLNFAYIITFLMH